MPTVSSQRTACLRWASASGRTMNRRATAVYRRLSNFLRRRSEQPPSCHQDLGWLPALSGVRGGFRGANQEPESSQGWLPFGPTRTARSRSSRRPTSRRNRAVAAGRVEASSTSTRVSGSSMTRAPDGVLVSRRHRPQLQVPAVARPRKSHFLNLCSPISYSDRATSHDLNPGVAVTRAVRAKHIQPVKHDSG